MALALDSRQLSKRFLLRHNPAGELKVRLLALFDRSRRQHVEEFWALRSLSLKIDEGEAVAMVGRNGSGKSTFLKLVAGIHSPTSGDLLIAEGGADRKHDRARHRLPPRADRAGERHAQHLDPRPDAGRRAGRSTTPWWPTPASSTSWTCR